jgi:rSAM/selenodomain-associated transferase 1
VGGTLRGSVMASAHILHTLSRYARWRPTPANAPARDDSRRQALFIVARTPIAGQAKTRLGAYLGHEAAVALYSTFLRDLGKRFTQAAARDGYDLWWHYTAPDDMDSTMAEATFSAAVPAGGKLLRQVGENFGQRLRYGFQALRERGYERIVVIGSDSPHLPAAWVRAAFVALREDDVVIGPARDGGYYLLGLRATTESCDLFTGVPMSASDTCARTVERAKRQNLSIAYTPRGFDVDEVSDLRLLRETLCAAPSRDADPAPETLAAVERITTVAPEPAVVATAPLVFTGAAHGQ